MKRILLRLRFVLWVPFSLFVLGFVLPGPFNLVSWVLSIVLFALWLVEVAYFVREKSRMRQRFRKLSKRSEKQEKATENSRRDLLRHRSDG